MRLTQDNDVVHALAADRPDQPFGKSVLPRRGGRNSLVAYAHGAQSVCDDSAKGPIPIADEVAGSLIPGECFCDLTRNPFRCRMSGDADPDKVSAVEPDNDEGVEQGEANRRDDEQIHRGDIGGMIAQKGAPSNNDESPPYAQRKSRNVWFKQLLQDAGAKYQLPSSSNRRPLERNKGGRVGGRRRTRMIGQIIFTQSKSVTPSGV